VSSRPPIRPVLLYDGECRFCRWSARVVARIDRSGRLALLPFQDDEAPPLLAPVPVEERLSSWHLVERDGRVLSRAGAAGAVAGRLLGRWATRPAATLDGLYTLVARHRGRLGRIVPDGPAPRAFP
jgi:predicted DCC family thiol-disulfide oxidoreductase YuxK